MGLFKKNKDAAPAGRNPNLPPQRDRAVFSYYSHRARTDMDAGQGSRPAGPGKPYSRWRYAPSYLALIGLVASASYVLSIDIKPRIVLQPADKASLLRDETVYQQAGEAILAESLLSRSKITIDTLALSRRLAQQFPEVESASVTLPLLGRRPVISLAPAQPALLLSSRSGLFVLDDKGQAILTAAQAGLNPAASDLPLISDESGLDIKIGSNVLTQQNIDFVGTLLAQLDSKGFSAVSLTLPALADELHVRVKDQPYFVKFNMASDPRQAAGTFLAVRERLEAEGQTPVEYIDVRVEERAYYK